MTRQMSISVAKASDKTSIDHNNRTMNKSELNKLTHIDQSRLNKNEYLVNIPIQDLYEKEFGEALSNYNAKQKRNDRKIDNYYEHICNSKKHMPQQEIIFQVGEYNDFEHEENREMAKDILREHFDRFQKDNPNLKIYNAVIHDDEATPHLHINFVPIADGYKRGLEKQVSFDRALIQQNPNLNKEQPFTEWRAEQVTQLEKALNEKNIDRKIVGTFDYKNQKEFKLKQDLEQEILGLRAEKHDVERNLVQEQEKLGTLEARREKLGQLSDKSVQSAQNFVKNALNDVKPTLLNKDIVQIPKKDLDRLTNTFIKTAESNIYSKQDYDKMKVQNEKIKGADSERLKEIHELKSRNRFLIEKVQERDEKINQLEVKANTLSSLNSVYSIFKDKIKDNHDRLQSIIDKIPLSEHYKNYLKGFVSATLTDRDLKEANEVAVYSINNDHKSALQKYKLGATVKEHKELRSQKVKGFSIDELEKYQRSADKKKEQERTQTKSRGRSR